MCRIGGTSYVYFLETQPTKAHKSLNGSISYISSAMAVGAAGVDIPGVGTTLEITLSSGETLTVPGPTRQGTMIKRALWRELVN